MIHESYQFDFPGRGYRFHHAAITHAAEVAALRAVVAIMEPVVVEALDERHEVFQLVAGDERGGAYKREPVRIRTLAHVDEAGLVAWFNELTQDGSQPMEELSLADGWFTVDANVGDVLRLHTQNSKTDIDIVERHGRPAVRAPNPSVLVAPFAIRLLSQTSHLEVAMHWSAWADPDGVGRACFQQFLGALTDAGWTLMKQPNPEDLAWPRQRTSAQPHA